MEAKDKLAIIGAITVGLIVGDLIWHLTKPVVTTIRVYINTKKDEA